MVEHVSTTKVCRRRHCGGRAPSLAGEQDQRDAATDQQAKQQFHDKRSFNWVAGERHSGAACQLLSINDNDSYLL
ncbi:conserved hypothetical protein [Cupriavidus taiwanensis]|nr:conserved hypothetical protein [Cupriavidus taiwanensis]